MTEKNRIESNHNPVMNWFWDTYYGPCIAWASHTVCPNSTFDVTEEPPCDEPQCPQNPLFDIEPSTHTP